MIIWAQLWEPGLCSLHPLGSPVGGMTQDLLCLEPKGMFLAGIGLASHVG